MRGASDAQDALADMVAQLLPGMSVRQEVPLASVVEAHGYSMREMEAETHRHLPDMRIDVYAISPGDSIAFEYQGEQHYASVGNMNATSNDVAYDQLLDETKEWVLRRVGVPIVQIAYDDPLTPSFLRARMEDATRDADIFVSGMSVCESCGRRFPHDRLHGGICDACRESGDCDDDDSKDDDSPVTTLSPKRTMHGCKGRVDDEYARRVRKERARQLSMIRKQRREEFKKSKEYADMRERQRAQRHERYMEWKNRQK